MKLQRISAFAPRGAGYSYLEMVAAIGIISVLIVTAINLLAGLRIDAERTAMESMVGALRSALGINVAEFITKGNVAGLRSLEGSNPMDRLAEQPKSYIGPRAGVNPNTIDRGKWYFDSDTRTLVYRVINEANFVGSAGSPARARYQVKLVYADVNGNQVFDQGVDVIEGVRLAAMEPYRWTE